MAVASFDYSVAFGAIPEMSMTRGVHTGSKRSEWTGSSGRTLYCSAQRRTVLVGDTSGESSGATDSRLRHLCPMKQGGQVIVGASVTNGYNEVLASKFANILTF